MKAAPLSASVQLWRPGKTHLECVGLLENYEPMPLVLELIRSLCCAVDAHGAPNRFTCGELADHYGCRVLPMHQPRVFRNDWLLVGLERCGIKVRSFSCGIYEVEEISVEVMAL